MTQPDPAEIAAKLTAKARVALLGPFPRAAHSIHPAHRRWFERTALGNEGYSRTFEKQAFFLSPLGLAVRRHLETQGPAR